MLSQKQRRTLSDEDEKNYALPQDFIEQQRAYFAEIDAFELSEAEVDSSNELDWLDSRGSIYSSIGWTIK